MKRLMLALILALCVCAAPEACAEGGGFYLADGVVLVAEAPPEEGALLKSLSMGLGETIMCVAPELDVCVFTSTKADIASFDEDNMLTAHKKGETYLRAADENGEYIQLKLTVRAAPTSIKLNAKSGKLAEDETYQMKATLSKNSASMLKWSSSDTDILQVDENGLLLGVNRGECTLSVSTFNGLSAECHVTVTPVKPAKIALNAKKGTLYVGENYQMVATLTGGRGETVAWVSGDERILWVDDYGVITAVATGTTRVRALASGGNYADCMVTVKPGSTDIRLKQTAVAMYAGGEYALEADVTGGGGGYSLISADESIAEIIESTTILRALGAGETLITARTPNGLTDECALTVYEVPARFGFSQDAIELCEGDDINLSFEMANDAPIGVIFDCDDTAVARVDDNGTVTGVKSGGARVRATSGGLSAYMDVTVIPIAKRIALNEQSGVLGEGDTRALSYELIDGGGRVLFSSDNPAVAVVDEHTGVIYALSEGAATITASLKNGLSAEYSLIVAPAPRTLTLSPREIVMGAGDSARVSYLLDVGSAAGITWTSGDEALISVDANGVIRSNGALGRASVSATTHNGISDTISVEIAPMPGKLSVDALELLPGGDFDAYVLISQGAAHALNPQAPGLTHITCTYESSYPQFASVDARGVVQGVAPGTSLIVVNSFSGLRLRVLVEVYS